MVNDNTGDYTPFECPLCGSKDYIKKTEKDVGLNGRVNIINVRVCVGCNSFMDVYNKRWNGNTWEVI